jgi:MraZ protein
MGRIGAVRTALNPHSNHMVNLNANLDSPAFTGEFRHKVEGKGRVTIPAKWRFEEEVEMFMIPKTAKRCITVLPRSEVERMKTELRAMPPEERADLLDIFGRNLRQVTLDKGGRITIPEDLCTAFKISGEVWLSGSVDTFNIWNGADFEANKAEEEARKASVMRRLGL